MPVTALRLPPGVHVCLSGRDYVFLDRMSDAYTGIAGPNATALDDCRAGAPLSPALEPLISAGLLARDDQPGRLFELTDPRLPSAALVPEPTATVDRRALLACFNADRLLRYRPFDAACRAAEAALAAAAPASPDLVAAAAARFAAARRWYPRSPGCLFDALSLLLYLARHQIAAQWVFGVRLAPWTAHCWVQVNDHLVGAGLETVDRLRPIMRIG